MPQSLVSDLVAHFAKLLPSAPVIALGEQTPAYGRLGKHVHARYVPVDPRQGLGSAAMAMTDGAVAIGIMLKHEPGFASENGDWEFAYWEAEPGLIDGPDQSAYCAGCHASSPTDFVFLDDSWRDSSEPQ